MIDQSILKQYSDLQNQINEMTKQADLIKRQIKSELTIGEHVIGEFKVSYVQRTRIDLDKELVTKALGDKVKECEKITGYEVLTLKRL
tara:strand:+ start:3343 stop:3606 length:264 start_codon:yes stop_codon:yes gene_type:complete